MKSSISQQGAVVKGMNPNCQSHQISIPFPGKSGNLNTAAICNNFARICKSLDGAKANGCLRKIKTCTLKSE